MYKVCAMRAVLANVSQIYAVLFLQLVWTDEIHGIVLEYMEVFQDEGRIVTDLWMDASYEIGLLTTNVLLTVIT